MRSTPIPNANPLIFLPSRALYAGSRPSSTRFLSTASNTAGSTIPQPSSSIHPECLHFRQPFPPQKMHEICTSALGSVNGKNEGKNRVFTPEPKNAFIA